jgi:hypothetical protein
VRDVNGGGREREDIAVPAIKAQCRHDRPELRQRLFVRQRPGGFPLGDRIGQAADRMHHRARLVDPVVRHALAHQRPGARQHGQDADQ